MGEQAALDDRLKRRLPRLLAASLLMAGLLCGAMQALGPMLALPGWRYAALAALVLLGMASYAGAVLALRAYRLADLAKSLRRQR